MTTDKYVLITGASTGLGREFALEAARRGMNCILAALPGENLAVVCDKCRNFGVKCIYYELDLTDMDSLLDMTMKINKDYHVCGLINNAGIGGSREFGPAPLKYIDGMINLNVRATTILTHEMLQNLCRNSRSFILNIASLAAEIPTGYKTVYPASKAYIKYFSLGMREELKRQGVSVSLALLGPMPTKPEIVKRIKKQGWLGKALTVQMNTVAQICLDATLKGRRIIVPGRMNRLSYNLLKLVPVKIKSALMSHFVAKHEISVEMA